MILAALPLVLHAAGADYQEGPLETRILRAIDVPFLRIEPRGDVLGSGVQSLSLSFSGANDMRSMQSASGNLYEDYEVDRLLFQYRRGIGDGLDYTIDLPIEALGGGFMDPLIEFWHQHVLGLDVPLRTNTPDGQCNIDLPNGETYKSAFGIGDIAGTITKKMNANSELSLAIKAPTGNAGGLLGSGAFDAGMAIQNRFKLAARLDLYGQFGEIFQGKATSLQGSRPWVDQECIALIQHANRLDDYIFQWNSERSAIVTGIAGSDSTQRSLSFGYRRNWSDRSIEAFFTEDGDWLNYRVPELDNIAPDFTFGVRYTVRY